MTSWLQCSPTAADPTPGAGASAPPPTSPWPRGAALGTSRQHTVSSVLRVSGKVLLKKEVAKAGRAVMAPLDPSCPPPALSGQPPADFP